MYSLPNLLTISRIVVIPVIFMMVYIHATLWQLVAAILFIVASITDYLDGYLARSRNETSAFGRLLDPIADKLLVTSALVVILAVPGMVVCKLSYIPVIVILCREILVSGLREFLMEVKVGMPVTRLAKWKTGFQMTALSMMLLKGFWLWGGIGEILLWIAGVLTFITGYQYFQKSLNYIKKSKRRQSRQPERVNRQQKPKSRPRRKPRLPKRLPVKKRPAKRLRKRLPSKGLIKPGIRMDKDKAHILVVDDDTRLRSLLQRFLRENGFYVSTAKDAAEARERLTEYKFDLLIVDIMMPNETGLAFWKSFALRAICR